MTRIAVLAFLLLFLGSSYSRGVTNMVLVTTEWPPFEYSTNGQAAGMDIDTVTKVFGEMGVPVEIYIYPWLRCQELCREKKADGIITIRKNEERLKYLLYPSESISESVNVFFYRKDKKFRFNSLADLKGLTIGITRGYSYGDEFMKAKDYTLDEAEYDYQGFLKLGAGRIDLFICDRRVGMTILKSAGMVQDISYDNTPISRFDMYIAFSMKPENREILKRFDRVLGGLKRKGVYTSITNRY